MFVLIVAKCNVNVLIPGINELAGLVLIVAKCNVNQAQIQIKYVKKIVLIVAKCNVNKDVAGYAFHFYLY